jgi:formate dehydrogenase subunit gamma
MASIERMNPKYSATGHHRWIIRSLLLSVLLVLVLPLIPYLVQYGHAGVGPGAVPNPGADLWRAIRQREGEVTGSSQVQGVDSGVLINTVGEAWRQFRLEILVPYGATGMGVMLAIIVLFYLVRGRIAIPGGRSGQKVPRFRVNERMTHWVTVIVFWLLALTGLMLLYGRFVLIPLLGPEGFAVTASAAKEIHNLFGPLFLVAIGVLFVIFVKDNLPEKEDLVWLAKGGGLFSGSHVSSGRFNAGEKIWFWIATLGGLAIGVSGLILDFPLFGQGRTVMSGAHVIHGSLALLVIVLSFAHIYIGTLGMEGSLESMTTGYVDANWAKSHHDRWYSRIRNAQGDTSGESGVPGGGVAGPRRNE